MIRAEDHIADRREGSERAGEVIAMRVLEGGKAEYTDGWAVQWRSAQLRVVNDVRVALYEKLSTNLQVLYDGDIPSLSTG